MDHTHSDGQAAPQSASSAGVSGWTAVEVEEVINALDDEIIRRREQDDNDAFAAVLERAGTMLDVLRPAEPSRPDILERLTYHQLERDDLTIDECLSYLSQRGWKEVHGRTDREMVMQILSLLALAPATRAPEARCIRCGCSDSHACEGGCSWIWVDRNAQQGLCSACGDTFSELDLAQAANELVALAERAGMCVRISRAPLQPLAMGHARHEVEIWPARNHVHSGEKPHA